MGGVRDWWGDGELVFNGYKDLVLQDERSYGEGCIFTTL